MVFREYIGNDISIILIALTILCLISTIFILDRFFVFAIYREVYVPDNVSSIMVALNIVSPGGTIYLRGGVYDEYIDISKSVNIIGLGNVFLREPIVIRSIANVSIANLSIAIYPPGSEIAIAIHNSSNIKLYNLTIIYSGIAISSSRDIEIYNSIFMEINFPAITIDGSSSDIVIRNNIFNSVYTALTVFSGKNIVFCCNSIYSARSYGVKLLPRSSHVEIYLNNFFNNTKCYDSGENNTWYNPIAKLGNYWEYVAGNSIDNKTCSYSIEIEGSSKSIDMYPLCTTFEKYLYLTKTNKSSSIQTLDIAPYIIIALISISIIFLVALWYCRRRGI